MLKKFLTTLALLTLSTSTAQALPAWAYFLAISQCDYMELGLNWVDSATYALRDNRAWFSDFPEDKTLFTQIWLRAGLKECPVLYKKSLEREGLIVNDSEEI